MPEDTLAGLYRDALLRFEKLFNDAQSLGLNEPAAASLATCGGDGRPAVRTVLLRAVDERGFVFYTNKQSRKGRQLEANGYAALCFFWQPLMQQVLVEGRVTDVSDRESDEYWAGRPRPSQLGAWASLQSEKLDSRDTLESRVASFNAKFEGREIPRPPHWGGYRIVPDMIEFWQSRPGRLHERERFFIENGSWRKTWLYP